MADMYKSFTSKIEFPARKSSLDQNKARSDIWNSILVSIHNQRTMKNYYSINQVLTGVRAAACRTPLKPKHDMNLDLYVISFKEIAALDDYRNHISPSHINEVIQELNSFNSFQSAVRFGEQSFTGYLILNYYKQTLACCRYVQSYR